MISRHNHKTPEYRLRANRLHSLVKTLCHQWVKEWRPEVMTALKKRAVKTLTVREGNRG